MSRHLVLLAVLFVAGCGALPPARQTPAQAAAHREKATRPAYNLAGYPPAVRDGYIDGCETAKRSQYGRKDAQRFGSDDQYAMGWKDGYSICGSKK